MLKTEDQLQFVKRPLPYKGFAKSKASVALRKVRLKLDLGVSPSIRFYNQKKRAHFTVLLKELLSVFIVN